MAHMDTARPTGKSKAAYHPDRITSDGRLCSVWTTRAGIVMLLHAAEQALRYGRGRKDFTLAFTVSEETTLAGTEVHPFRTRESGR